MFPKKVFLTEGFRQSESADGTPLTDQKINQQRKKNNRKFEFWIVFYFVDGLIIFSANGDCFYPTFVFTPLLGPPDGPSMQLDPG